MGMEEVTDVREYGPLKSADATASRTHNYYTHSTDVIHSTDKYIIEDEHTVLTVTVNAHTYLQS